MFKKKILAVVFIGLVMFGIVAFYATYANEPSKLECSDLSLCHDVGGCPGKGSVTVLPCEITCKGGYPIIDCVKL